MKQNKLKYSLFFLLGLFSCKKEREPNIIIILIDDAGYADFGFMGSNDLQTPNIDCLANEGVIFTDAHTTSTVCAPSRAGILTGKYQQRFGFECNEIPAGMGLDTNQVLLPLALKEKGYATLAIGKWHLGDKGKYLPSNRGFDEFYGFYGGARSYFPYPADEKTDSEKRLRNNTEITEFEGYLTDRFGDRAVEFIEENKNKAFFIYFSPNAVHSPMEAREDHLERFKNAKRPVLSAMMWSLDENIGKITDKLKEEKIYDNTLIFFLSDNGGALSNHASCEPLKGWKGNKYEGGHRVPFFITWPAKIKDGKKFEGLTSSLDIYPTSLRAAGMDIPLCDGTDLLAFLTGERSGNPHSELYWRKDKMAAARSGSLKLVRVEGYGSNLYDLNTDPGEENNLASIDTSGAQLLSNNLLKWESEMKEPGWREAEEWNKVNMEIHQALMQNREPMYKNPRELREYCKKPETK